MHASDLHGINVLTAPAHTRRADAAASLTSIPAPDEPHTLTCASNRTRGLRRLKPQTQGSRQKMRHAVRESGVYEGPCKAARGVRVLGRPRTFRHPKNRPSPREPIGESNPTASSHTGDGAPARARMRAASVHTRCAWRPGGEDRATKKRAVRVLSIWEPRL